MMSSEDDCAALSEQISLTLKCEEKSCESEESCGLSIDQNKKTQKEAVDGQEKCSEEENARKVATENEDDSLIVQILETDSDQLDTEDGSKFEVMPCSLAAAITMAYVPEDARHSVETAGFPKPEDEEDEGPVAVATRSLACTVDASFAYGAPLDEDDEDW